MLIVENTFQEIIREEFKKHIQKNAYFKKYSARPLQNGAGFFYLKKKCLTKQSCILYKKVYTIKHKGVYYGYHEHFER